MRPAAPPVAYMKSSLSVDAIANRDVARRDAGDVACSSQSSFQESASGTSDSLLGEESIQRIVHLERELIAARCSIAEKEAKCERLSQLQHHVDSEVQELTEKLFQEAYKMVNDAESRKARAERLLAESKLKVDMLTAEVEALKIIVKSPSSHFHASTPPQKAGFAARLLTSSRKDKHSSSPATRKSASLPAPSRNIHVDEHKRETSLEIDAVYHREFANWRESGAPLSDDSPFLCRVMLEEVAPCLSFDNTRLAERVLAAIKKNTLELEPVKESKPTVRMCALSNVPRPCPYRLRVNGDREWYLISMLVRNRIAAVCDFFTYMRYVNRGIVKSGVLDSYWDVVNLRKNMALARLGLGFVTKTGRTSPQETR